MANEIIFLTHRVSLKLQSIVTLNDSVPQSQVDAETSHFQECNVTLSDMKELLSTHCINEH